MTFKIKEGKVVLDSLPKKFKKITATRFATVLGLNPFKTPFQAWCEITRTYEVPFTDNQYTIAGKTIEPKIIDYLKNTYFMDIKDPTDVYGQNYFDKTRGDFFPENTIFGGMWDVVGDDCVVEIKTTKNSTDWLEGIPEYYKLQASLYAWLSGVDDVYMVCAFLDDKDYDDPSKFVPSSKNTIIRNFSLQHDYPDFYETYIRPAEDWWDRHVVTGESPAFDEKKDTDFLKVLRTSYVEVDDASVEILLKRIAEKHQALAKLKDELEKDKNILKEYMTKRMTEKDKSVEIKSDGHVFSLTKVTKTTVNSAALKKDGLYDKYAKQSVSFTLNIKEEK